MKELNKIYNKDCIELMRELESESVDLVIADPPYNLNKDFGNGSDNWDSVDEWLAWTKTWIDECIRILKPTGSIFIYGIHHFIGYIQVYLYKREMKYRRLIIWHYENGFSGYRNVPAATYEPILWFSKTDDYTYHMIRVPYKSKKRLKNKITKNGKVWKPHPDGKHGGDVWKIPTLAGNRFSDEKVDHPTQKPLKLCNRIVNHFSNPAELVCVPFAGSGSECVSCASNERDFIGAEINEDYLKIAQKRLDNVQLSLSDS